MYINPYFLLQYINSNFTINIRSTYASTFSSFLFVSNSPPNKKYFRGFIFWRKIYFSLTLWTELAMFIILSIVSGPGMTSSLEAVVSSILFYSSYVKGEAGWEMKVILQFGKCSIVATPAFWTRTKHTAMVVFHRYLLENGNFNRGHDRIQTPTFHLEQNTQ